jgi:ornithine cyclodeaminase/alanine dehydrogenase
VNKLATASKGRIVNHAEEYKGTLLLSRKDIASLVTLDDCIDAVESAFRDHAQGKSLGTGILHMDAPDGEFHIKAGGLHEPSLYFALKANAGFFNNAERFGLPNIQGLILVYSAENGYPLAVLDSLGITGKRTGAATAVAAKYLARPDSKIATICGCGTQGRVQLRSLAKVLPIEKAHAYSIFEGEADRFASEMGSELGIDVVPAAALESAVGASDVCVTCTPAREYFLKEEYVRPGSFIAAVGADSPDKQELDPKLIANNTLVVDLAEQCVDVGELHHALKAKLMTEADVHAELGDIIAGKKPGRTRDDEITIFDSTGTALQDTAAAIVAYERARQSGAGQVFGFGAPT